MELTYALPDLLKIQESSLGQLFRPYGHVVYCRHTDSPWNLFIIAQRHRRGGREAAPGTARVQAEIYRILEGIRTQGLDIVLDEGLPYGIDLTAHLGRWKRSFAEQHGMQNGTQSDKELEKLMDSPVRWTNAPRLFHANYGVPITGVEDKAVLDPDTALVIQSRDIAKQMLHLRTCAEEYAPERAQEVRAYHQRFIATRLHHSYRRSAAMLENIEKLFSERTMMNAALVVGTLHLHEMAQIIDRQRLILPPVDTHEGVKLQAVDREVPISYNIHIVIPASRIDALEQPQAQFRES